MTGYSKSDQLSRPKREPRDGTPDQRAAIYKQVIDRECDRLGVFICPECGKKIKDRRKIEVDHIKKRSQGGKTVLSNLRAVCGGCHILKHGGQLGTTWDHSQAGRGPNSARPSK